MAGSYYLERFRTDLCQHGKRYDNTPRFTYIGKHTVIGVGHTANIDKGHKMAPKELDSFYKNVMQASRLIMEGSREKSAPDDGSFEQAAINSFLRKHQLYDVHFLEDGSNLTAYSKKYGFDPYSYTVADTIGRIYEGGGVEELERLTPELISQGSKNLVTVGSDMRSLDQSSLATYMTMFVENIINLSKSMPADKLHELIFNGWPIFVWYLGKVRDIETIVPRWKELTSNFSGKTATIIGDIHVPAISLACRGKAIPPLPQWSEFKNLIKREYKEVIELMERMMHEKVS